jgi:dimethylhistidine N-methyltransferase
MTPDGSRSQSQSRVAVAASSSQEHVSGGFMHDVIVGLSSSPKRLSPKYFYDREGSLLFDAICDLPEYYVTRTELSILEKNGSEIASRLCCSPKADDDDDDTQTRTAHFWGSDPVRVVEPGAGSGTKTRLLLHALGPRRCVEYVPVDIAGEHLEHTAAALRRELPWLRVTPFAADFSVDLPLPATEVAAARTVIYFPGSTIGNFDPTDAKRLLARFRSAAGPDGLVLLGVDLKKEPALLHSAYNDAQGVTAAFNKNVMRRMNLELGADFDFDAFHHYAFYEPVSGRIEMHLISARRQDVHVGGKTFTFDEGESICTERSYKYDLATAERVGRAAGLALTDGWLDDERRFAVLLFRAPK